MRNMRSNAAIKPREVLRLETFSDGVFAIAITLLVLELIQILHTNDKSELSQLLLKNWKFFLVFFIGFLTILICWINHHLVLSYAERVDGKLFWINGLVLLVVTFTPFPTAILAEYFDRESHMALAIFGFNYIMMSVAAYAISAYIYRKLSTKKEGNDLLYYHMLLYKYCIPYNVLTFFVCFVSVPLALFLYVLMFIVFANPMESSRRLQNRKRAKRGPHSKRMESVL
jgi:uncharacterized membrane protein